MSSKGSLTFALLCGTLMLFGSLASAPTGLLPSALAGAQPAAEGAEPSPEGAPEGAPSLDAGQPVAGTPLATETPVDPEAPVDSERVDPERVDPETVDPETGEPAEETEAELPKLEDLPLPGAEELLGNPPRDRVVLKSMRVLETEPIVPRPKTLRIIQNERDEITLDRTRWASAAGKKRLAELLYLTIVPIDDESNAEYRIEIALIDHIVHHEDMMLQRADQLIESGSEADLRTANELLFTLSRMDSQWPGLGERERKLRLAHAEQLVTLRQPNRAVAVIETLYEEPATAEVRELLSQAADQLIGQPLSSRNYRQARFEFGRIRKLDPTHPHVKQWQNRLTAAARQHRDSASDLSAAGKYAEAAEQIELAALAWPSLTGLSGEHARITRQYQRLSVGVARLALPVSVAPSPENVESSEETGAPEETETPEEARASEKARASGVADESLTTAKAAAAPQPILLPGTAELRVRRLTHADFFELEGFNTVPVLQSSYFENWEPTDLGRQATFLLRSHIPEWSARPLLTTPTAVSLLASRMNGNDPTFDPRFADEVATLRVSGSTQFDVLFRRIPLRLETMLSPLPIPVPGGLPPAEVFERFVEVERQEDRVRYRRRVPETTATGPRHVAEVVERIYPSYEDTVRAFDRGEIQMLDSVPLWDLPRLEDDRSVTVVPLAVPVTHLLLFHPQSVPLQSTELRRALAASVEARELLRLLTGEGRRPLGQVVSAPFPVSHPGYNLLIRPREPDRALAFALSLAAKRGKLENATLTLVAPSDPEVWRLAERMTEGWNRIGIPIILKAEEQLRPGEPWDIAYRTAAVADPVSMLGPLLAIDEQASLNAFGELPDWLRQSLVDLERVGDAASAHDTLRELHRALFADVRVIPLFEVTQYLATRGRIEGLPAQPTAVYQNVEHWVLPQDYPEEVW